MDGGDCCVGEDKDGDDVILEGDVSGVVIGVVEVGCEVDGATAGRGRMYVLRTSCGVKCPFRKVKLSESETYPIRASCSKVYALGKEFIPAESSSLRCLRIDTSVTVLSLPSIVAVISIFPM
ncbi:hypothetical protein Tco_0929009 [Tanacetum coccineum]